MTKTKKPKKKLTPWRAAMNVPVVRGNSGYEPKDLEPGVKFFILMLEELGCTTQYSCEGHPEGFYIMFTGPYYIAKAVAQLGILEVASNLEWKPSQDNYVVRLPWFVSKPRSNRRRNELLNEVARRWVKEFGPLKLIRYRNNSDLFRQPKS